MAPSLPLEHGLVGWRAGKVQRMTTKNGLPCNIVITFIEDKEKRWWLYTRCGVVEIADSELQRWWADPGAVLQTRVYDQLDGAQPNNGSFSLAASPDGRRVVCQRTCRTGGRPIPALAKEPPAADFHRISYR